MWEQHWVIHLCKYTVFQQSFPNVRLDGNGMQPCSGSTKTKMQLVVKLLNS